MECKPCGKTFTGEVCYNQHLQSEKHKRKARLYENSSNHVIPSIPIDPKPKLLSCAVCNLAFDSLEEFQIHALSSEHAKNVMSNTEANGINCSTISSSSSGAEIIQNLCNEDKVLDKSDTIFPDFDDERMPSGYKYSSCEVCNKTFSGPAPYKQHMVSEPHRKKVELQKNYPMGVATNQSASSFFVCEPCKKTFSGQIPYIQHMTSDIHKKRLQHLEALERYNASRGLDLENPDAANCNLQPANNPYFCHICNVQCSGIAPYEQHLQGSTHLKNAAKAQYQNAINKSYPADPAISGQRVDSSSKPNGDVCDGKISTSNLDQELDYVLPELAEKLRVMSTDELENCVTVFKPDDSIDFDQLESKQMQIDPKEHDTPGENQVEIKAKSSEIQTEINAKNGSEVDEPKSSLNETKVESDFLQMCHICDVTFLGVKDALCHYESREHYNKKWHPE